MELVSSNVGHLVRKLHVMIGNLKSLSDCSVPAIPEHGTRSGSVFKYGYAIHYHCDEGYKLIGNHSRVCMSSGRWTGEDPECIVKGMLLSFFLANR